MTIPQRRHWLTVDEVAEGLGVSRMTVYRLVKGTDEEPPKLRAYRIGRSIRIDARDIAPYLNGADMAWESKSDGAA